MREPTSGRLRSCAPGAVQVEIHDSGPGLSGQDLDTLQEPFFSTKSSGVGMGLGLAITTEILGAHSGSLTAKDATEGGAIFVVTLPCDEGQTA